MNITINIKQVEQNNTMKDDIESALRIIWANHYDGQSATFDSESLQAVHELLFKHTN